jgi:two-component system, NtrC family, sensor kinase
MIMSNPFPTIELIHLIYFFYGSSFLFLCFSIGTKNMRGSNLRIAHSLWLLAMFGLMHGVREIVEIYPLIEGDELTVPQIYNVEILSTVLLVLSFMFLLQFGLSLLHENTRKRILWSAGTFAALGIIWFFFIELHGTYSKMQVVRQIQIGARNTFGLFGGLAAAYGLITYSHSREIQNLTYRISRNLYYAGIVFAINAFLTTAVFSHIARLLDIPKELLRSGAAALIAYFIMKALNIFDIETRRKVEKQARELVQKERLASLGQLAAGIAHEINNPLTNASLGVQTLKNKLKNDTVEAIVGQLSAVEKNIDRAAAIAQELLLFSRERETEFLALNVHDVITNALESLKHRMHRVVLEQNLTPVPEVKGDRGKLQQVFVNVLSNALEAMPKGGKISISTAVGDAMVEVRIADTGTGMTEETAAKAFEPFFTTKEIGLGTGLGLYLCYGIITQHHGTIELSSVVGQGTTVTIKLPAGA